MRRLILLSLVAATALPLASMPTAATAQTRRDVRKFAKSSGRTGESCVKIFAAGSRVEKSAKTARKFARAAEPCW